MENKSGVPNNISADLVQSWHIPRPTLARSSKSSQGSTSSNNSTQSARSGSLLLTAANLAQIANEQQSTATTTPGERLSNRDQNIKYYLEHTDHNDLLLSLPNTDFNKKIDPDSVSIASSMHFTVVNVNARPPVKPRSFCRKHQLTILVVTMSVLFTIGILCAIVFLEMRARRQRWQH